MITMLFTFREAIMVYNDGNRWNWGKKPSIQWQCSKSKPKLNVKQLDIITFSIYTVSEI